MSKLKTILYNCTIIFPVISKIYKSIKFIVEFNKTNQEVIAARNDILNEVKYLQSVVREINEFHHVETVEEEF